MQPESLVVKLKPTRERDLARAGLLLLGAGLSVAGYLFASSRLVGAGFPLDDAWIHQTYARNLAQFGQWAFIPGQPSAGSTAPLWSALIAIGYLLRIPYLGWTFFLGGLSLLGLGLAGEGLARRYLSGASAVPWAGLLLVGEYHLAWAAVSGMETLLFGLCILLVLGWCGRARGRAWGAIGLLVGLSIWVRPDGITLLGPAAFTLLLAGKPRTKSWPERAKGLAWLAGGAALLFVPYLLFNLFVQGSLWPNTFYAKQAEYAALRDLPALVRFFNEVTLPLVGSGLFLLPGFARFCWQAWRERDWAAAGMVLWFFGYALLYALRLPVTYQYGRYFIPAMPIYFILGLAGTARLVQELRGNRVQRLGSAPDCYAVRSRANRLAWLLARVGMLSSLVIWLAFYVIGAGRYAQNVAVIETEMVATAKWVAVHTPPQALVAAHDIGALGYFGQRRLLDLAGLVSPEVIPFIRDEPLLAQWLDEQHADYLVTLAGWYGTLPEGKTPVFQTHGRFSVEAGGTNMVVYRWR